MREQNLFATFSKQCFSQPSNTRVRGANEEPFMLVILIQSDIANSSPKPAKKITTFLHLKETIPPA